MDIHNVHIANYVQIIIRIIRPNAYINKLFLRLLDVAFPENFKGPNEHSNVFFYFLRCSIGKLSSSFLI